MIIRRTLYNRAFSLLELLVCLGVIGVLCAALLPVFARAKDAGQKTECFSNFHQYAIAVSMYRADYEGADMGSASQMGLPLGYHQLLNDLNCPLQGQPNPIFTKNWGYIWSVEANLPESEWIWERRVAAYGDKVTIMIDINHNSFDTIGKRYFPHYGIGLNLNGTVFKKIQPGEPFLWETWWTPQGG